jgi:hypothetical protein
MPADEISGSLQDGLAHLAKPAVKDEISQADKSSPVNREIANPSPIGTNANISPGSNPCAEVQTEPLHLEKVSREKDTVHTDLLMHLTELRNSVEDLKRQSAQRNSLEDLRSALELQMRNDLSQRSVANELFRMSATAMELKLVQASMKRNRSEIDDLQRQNAILRRKLAQSEGLELPKTESLADPESDKVLL